MKLLPFFKKFAASALTASLFLGSPGPIAAQTVSRVVPNSNAGVAGPALLAAPALDGSQAWSGDLSLPAPTQQASTLPQSSFLQSQTPATPLAAQPAPSRLEGPIVSASPVLPTDSARAALPMGPAANEPVQRPDAREPRAAVAAEIAAMAKDVGAGREALAAPAQSDVSLTEGARGIFERLQGQVPSHGAAGLPAFASPASSPRPALASPRAFSGALALAVPLALHPPLLASLDWPDFAKVVGASVVATLVIAVAIVAFLAHAERFPTWFSALRHLPSSAAKWVKSRLDPVERAQRKTDKRLATSLETIQEKVPSATGRLHRMTGWVETLAEALFEDYHEAREEGGALLGEDIRNLVKAKRKLSDVVEQLPGSEADVDYSDWLGGITASDIDSQGETISPHFSSLLYKAVAEVLRKDYKLEQVVSYNRWGMRQPANVRRVQVGNDAYEDLVIDGSHFVEDAAGRRVIVAFDAENHAVRVTYPREHPEAREEFMGRLHAWIRENHIYRGQRLGFSHGRFYFLDGVKDDITWKDYIIADQTRRDLEFFTTNWLAKVEQMSRDLQGPSSKDLKSGVFFYGPKGTGKTLLSHVLMNETRGRATFIDVSAASIGDEKGLLALFNGAREIGLARVPVMVNFNEFDTLGAVQRDGKQTQFLGELLNQLDGVQKNEGLLLIATSNLPPTKMDSALFRPGRFEFVVQLPEPDQGTRLRLLEHYFKGVPLEEGFALERFAASESTKGFLPVHYKQLAQLSYRVAALDAPEGGGVAVRAAHVEKAIEIMRQTQVPVQPVKP